MSFKRFHVSDNILADGTASSASQGSDDHTTVSGSAQSGDDLTSMSSSAPTPTSAERGPCLTTPVLRVVQLP